ncbi:MAG TPA: flavin prenyltransferase UbiX [Burkholderiales bacterium]|nr:flavin prenyltransferase UbiX [Burkholderiales bacterium]
MNKNITLAVTGASGIPIAFALLQQLLKNNCVVHLVISNSGIITVKQETGVSLSSNPNTIKDILIKELQLENVNNLLVYSNNDWYAPIASGSSVGEAMVICPCSMATLGKIASGISEDLLVRAADVIIKERKNLLLVPRETPFSAIHLENMLKLSRLGVSIIPPVLEFYTHPKTLVDMVDFIVSRILDQLGIKNNLISRWSSE